MSDKGGDKYSPYEKLIRKAFADAIPLAAQFELTYRCNHLCEFCYNAPTGQKEMTTPQVFEALRKISELGVLYVNLTGGEPLVHKDFFKIAGEVRRLEMAIRIYSNGFLLARQQVVDRIRDLNPVEVEISIHGARPETHEALTRIKGSFDKTVAGIGNLTRAGIKVQAKCPITRLNRNELYEIRDLATSLGAYMTFDAVITPKDDGDPAPLNLRADDEFFQKYWAEDYASLHGGRLPPRQDTCAGDQEETACGVGRSGFTLDPYGNILPCTALRRKAGNILEIEDIKEFWRSSVVLSEVRQLSIEARRRLDEHESGKYFQFCMGTADAQTGDPLAMYPQAEINAGAVRRAYEVLKIEEKSDTKTA